MFLIPNVCDLTTVLALTWKLYLNEPIWTSERNTFANVHCILGVGMVTPSISSFCWCNKSPFFFLKTCTAKGLCLMTGILWNMDFVAQQCWFFAFKNYSHGCLLNSLISKEIRIDNRSFHHWIESSILIIIRTDYLEFDKKIIGEKWDNVIKSLPMILFLLHAARHLSQ